jgi:hypothetical protein
MIKNSPPGKPGTNMRYFREKRAGSGTVKSKKENSTIPFQHTDPVYLSSFVPRVIEKQLGN